MPHQTLGQFLLADILPNDVYTPGQVIDKKSVKSILGNLATNHPEKYKETVHKLVQLGKEVSVSTGGGSFGVSHLRTPPKAAARREVLRQKATEILRTMPPDKRNDAIVALMQEAQKTDKDEIVAEADSEGNPLALLLKGAGRGNPASLARLLGSDLMYGGPDGKAIPVPILNSYSQGLTPAEYIASTFGARKGIVDTKLSVSSGGYLAKLLNSAAHRMVVTADDAPPGMDEENALRGLPVDTTDSDNVGTLLAVDVGPYKRNTVLTPKILAHLDKLGHDEIVVRSPITSADPDGGVYAKDIGEREMGKFPEVGSSVGVTAAAAIAEPITQSALNSKHKGGVAENKQGLGGFELLDKMFNTPKEFREAASYSGRDGKVSKIEPAPQGGHYVFVEDEPHYVGPDKKILVSKDQSVEAGDPLTDGPINPRAVIQHKGLGEGARQLSYAIRSAIRDSGSNANRRNIELVVRGLVDRVRVTNEFDDYSPDDIVPYNQIASRWRPREGHRVSGLQSVAGRYLEKPVLHYSIGTRVTPSVVSRLQKHNIKQIVTHAKPPPFQSEMVRAVDLLKSDADWATRQIGTGLEKGLLDATHRGLESDEQSTSFVPARARAVDFNRTGLVKLPVGKSPMISLGHQ